MKSIFSVLLVLLFVSCNSDDDPVITDYKEANEKEIMEYIELHNLDATRTPSGLYYVVEEQGEGEKVTNEFDVATRYKGYLTDGTIVDQNLDRGITLNVQDMLEGWAEGVQFFNEGGKGMVLIPAHLAFGNRDLNGVPGGSVIIIEFEIIDYHVENELEIREYIEDNGLNAIESESGLFYVIEEPGTGAQPIGNSEVTVVYQGYFTDGRIFDQSPPMGITFFLDQVIPGWTEGMQYFKEGGSGKLIIPSALGYGKYGNQDIPGGSVIIFDVNLRNVN